MPSTNPGTATEFGPSTSAPAKIGGAHSANQVGNLVLHAIRFSHSWHDCVYLRGRLHHGLAHPLTRNYYLTRSERTLPGRVRPAMLDEGEITL
jgi:hypothetical protein